MYWHVGGVVIDTCCKIKIVLLLEDLQKHTQKFHHNLVQATEHGFTYPRGSDGETSTDGIILLQELSVIHPTLVLST